MIHSGTPNTKFIANMANKESNQLKQQTLERDLQNTDDKESDFNENIDSVPEWEKRQTMLLNSYLMTPEEQANDAVIKLQYAILENIINGKIREGCDASKKAMTSASVLTAMIARISEKQPNEVYETIKKEAFAAMEILEQEDEEMKDQPSTSTAE